MSAQSNKALIEQYLEAIHTDKSPATLDTYISDELLKEHIAVSEAAFADYWIEVKDIVAEGDKVVVRGTIHGVHTGSLMNIAPTGSEVAIQSFSTYRLENGKIAEHWMLVDMLTLLQQIGAVSAPSLI